MGPVTALLLGLIQGLTEFLPVSSTAHLVLAERLFGVAPGLSFDVALHAGTLLAVCVYFRAEVWGLVRGALGLVTRPRPREERDQRLLLMLLVGTVPAAALGIAFRDVIAGQLRTPAVIAVALIGVALVILAIERRCAGERDMRSLGLLQALWVGVCQAAALVPGVSRSGATIAGGLALGLRREEAVRFSFLLGLPAIAGGVVLEGREVLAHGFGEAGWQAFAIGTAAAAASGFACIAFLIAYVRTRSFTPFMLYRIALGIVVLAVVAG